MKSSGIPVLLYPFSGSYPISFPFGASADSEYLRIHYKKVRLQGHAGVDFDLPAGTPILAAADGKVVRAGENGDFGICVTLSHDWGISLYAHLQSVKVVAGRRVKRGECLGISGATGFVTGPHLHFAVKPAGADEQNGYQGFVDPVPYIKKKHRKKI